MIHVERYGGEIIQTSASHPDGIQVEVAGYKYNVICETAIFFQG